MDEWAVRGGKPHAAVALVHVTPCARAHRERGYGMDVHHRACVTNCTNAANSLRVAAANTSVERVAPALPARTQAHALGFGHDDAPIWVG
jgi:hypothetical protein